MPHGAPTGGDLGDEPEAEEQAEQEEGSTKRKIVWLPMRDSIKTVVCFGDSNTWGAWGHADKQSQRMPYMSRWTSVLQNKLSNRALVIPEGLNGRTTVMDDPLNFRNNGCEASYANGRKYLLPMLHSHKPVDLVVLGLGCNDLKTRFALSPSEIAKGCSCLISEIRSSGCGPEGSAPMIVLISPPSVRLEFQFHADFGPQRAQRSLTTIQGYRKLAEEEELDGFVSLETVPTSEDGLHYDEQSSRQIGAAVADAVLAAFADKGDGQAKKKQHITWA